MSETKEIYLHRRCITGLSVLPQRNLIGTISEDGYIHILEIKWSNVQIIRTIYIPNAILTGIQFIPISNNDNKTKNIECSLLVSSYDRKKLVIV